MAENPADRSSGQRPEPYTAIEVRATDADRASLPAKLRSLPQRASQKIGLSALAQCQHRSMAPPAMTTSTAAPTRTISAGGAGNDAYIVDNSGDGVSEQGNGGIGHNLHVLSASFDLSSAANVENLVFTGTAGFTRQGAATAPAPSSAPLAPTISRAATATTFAGARWQ